MSFFVNWNSWWSSDRVSTKTYFSYRYFSFENYFSICRIVLFWSITKQKIRFIPFLSRHQNMLKLVLIAPSSQRYDGAILEYLVSSKCPTDNFITQSSVTSFVCQPIKNSLSPKPEAAARSTFQIKLWTKNILMAWFVICNMHSLIITTASLVRGNSPEISDIYN